MCWKSEEAVGGSDDTMCRTQCRNRATASSGRQRWPQPPAASPPCGALLLLSRDPPRDRAPLPGTRGRAIGNIACSNAPDIRLPRSRRKMLAPRGRSATARRPVSADTCLNARRRRARRPGTERDDRTAPAPCQPLRSQSDTRLQRFHSVMTALSVEPVLCEVPYRVFPTWILVWWCSSLMQCCGTRKAK